jgi:hypothetical protein
MTAILRTSGRVPWVPLSGGLGRELPAVTEPAAPSSTFRNLHGPETESRIGGWAAWRTSAHDTPANWRGNDRTHRSAYTTRHAKADPIETERIPNIEGPSEIKEGLLPLELRLDSGLPIGGTQTWQAGLLDIAQLVRRSLLLLC